jgi:hypothetical protein
MVRAIYADDQSPYHQLLRLSGCVYGDVETLVRREGVEGALAVLCRSGVYLTVDEFKGRRPAVRGSATIVVRPERLRNPAAFALGSRTSGSRGSAMLVPSSLDASRDRAVNTCLTLDAHGGRDWVKAVWGLSTGALGLAIRYGGFGAPVARSFGLVDPAAPGLHPRYRWSARVLGWASRVGRLPLPRYEHVPAGEPLPIARWMAEVLRAGRIPHLWAFVSPAVRLCQAAVEAGVDIRGARFTITGEPITAARRAAIRRAGADAMADYGSAESGPLGHGCLAPEAPDEVHLFHDLHGVIQAPDLPGHGLTAGSLLVTSLRPTALVAMLNVSMGDRATVTSRACGCPLQTLGWTRHVHTVRSDEKLTAGGMTFLDGNLVRVLEEVLPARFGGGPTDYQLVEDEAPGGRPRLSLVVHPAVGPLAVDAVTDAFLSAIGDGSPTARVMALEWRQGSLLRVSRRPPTTGTDGTSGKILHVVREHPGEEAPSPAP